MQGQFNFCTHEGIGNNGCGFIFPPLGDTIRQTLRMHFALMPKYYSSLRKYLVHLLETVGLRFPF